MNNAVRNEALKHPTVRHAAHAEAAVSKSQIFFRNAMSVVVSFTLVCGLLPIFPSSHAYADESISPDEVAATAQVAKDEVLITYEDKALDVDEAVSVNTSGSDSSAGSKAPSEEITLQDCGVVEQEEVAAAAGEQGAVTVAQLDKGVSTEEAIEQLEAADGVASVQPNYVYSLLTTTTSDTYAVDDEMAESNQYYLFKSGVVNAWDNAKAEGSITVATIDTGCNLQHEDLRGTVDSEHAYDVTANTRLSEAGVANYGDANGHGTLVAGVIAAQANNGVGIAGASYNATVLPIKVFNDKNQCTTADLIAAYGYLDTLLDQGEVSNLRVINMSLGYYSQGDDQADEALRSAIATMRSEHNVLTVCAGGNGDSSGKARTATCYPSDFEECLSVTALDTDGSAARFSDYNSAKDVSSYGVNVLSTAATGGYAGATGTSMAAPQVTAAAALLWTADKNLTAQQVVDALKNTATEIKGAQPGNGSAGALNAQAAVASVLGLPVDEGADEPADADGAGGDVIDPEEDPGTMGSSLKEEVGSNNSDGAELENEIVEEGANSWRYKDGKKKFVAPKVDSGVQLFAAVSPVTWSKANGKNTFSYKGKKINVAGVKRIGIDVCSYQGKINWAKVKADGISFAILRCGSYSTKKGEHSIDSRFVENVKGALANNIEIGVYLYSYAENVTGAKSAKQEAQNVLSFLKQAGVSPSKLAMPVFYDMEFDDQMSYGADKLGKMAKTFCDTISDAGYTVGIYANKNWWDNYLTSSVFKNPAWHKWVARYRTMPSTGVSGTELWQFSDCGKVSGINGDVDMDFDYVDDYQDNKFIQATVSAVATQKYTGSAITPTPTVKLQGKTLTKNTDYTLSYKNNINAGTATITIKGKGGYTGSKSTTFKIVKSLSGATISSTSAKTYTGVSIKPTPTVKLDGTTLKNGTDYTLSYKNNKNVGKATITVTGKGKYTGSKSATFTIAKAKLSNARISSIGTKTYTGKSIKPTPTVKLSGNKLVKGADYTVSYKNNLRAGTATVTVKATGKNCTGSKSATFKIKPAKVTNVKVSSTKKGKITVKWSNVKGYAANVTGYKIVVKYGSKTIKTQYVSGRLAKSKTITLASKYKGKKVKTYVYAYKTISKTKVCSSASSVKTVKVKK